MAEVLTFIGVAVLLGFFFLIIGAVLYITALILAESL